MTTWRVFKGSLSPKVKTKSIPHLPLPPLAFTCCLNSTLVHRWWLIALSGLCILGEGWLLVIVSSNSWVGGIGGGRIRSGINVVLDEVIYPSFVSLVGKGSQQALEKEWLVRVWVDGKA